jgi:hypothetical protein
MQLSTALRDPSCGEYYRRAFQNLRVEVPMDRGHESDVKGISPDWIVFKLAMASAMR